jgi:general secretion pathway protein C
MLSRFFALLIWGAVALSAAYWGLRWFGKPLAVPPGTTPATMDTTLRGDLSKLLSGPAPAEGSTEPPPEQAALAGRLQLLGLVAPRDEGGQAGVALLVLDGKPARAYKIGQMVDGDLMVQAITQRNVQIGPQDGPASVTLELPLMPGAATGTLAPATGIETPTSPVSRYAPPPPVPAQAGTGMASTPVEGMDANGAATSNDAAAAQAAPRASAPRARRLFNRGTRPGVAQPATPDPNQAI